MMDEKTQGLKVELLENLAGLSQGRLSREAIFSWCEKVNHESDGIYAPLAVEDGYWELYSLYGILEKSDLEIQDRYFIRDEDILQYIDIIRKVNCDECYGKYRRLRPHQVTVKKTSGFNLLHLMDRRIFTRNGINTIRGVFSNLNSLDELAVLGQEDDCFVVMLDHKHLPGLVRIIGDQLANIDSVVEFLSFLGVTASSIVWVNEKTDSQACELIRRDDNGNEFSMGKFATYIAAELTRLEYERRGHKQTYSLNFIETKKM